MLVHLDRFQQFFYIKSIVIRSSSDGCKLTFKIPIWDMLINKLIVLINMINLLLLYYNIFFVALPYLSSWLSAILYQADLKITSGRKLVTELSVASQTRYITDLMKVTLRIGNCQLHGYWAFGHANKAMICFLGHQTTTAKGTISCILKQYLLINQLYIEHPEKEINEVKCCER